MAEPTKEPTPTPSGKTAYLTFDDGPDAAGYTSEIALSLFNQGIQATFFVNGGTYLGQVTTIKEYGHAIGLHGWTHPRGDENVASKWWHPYFSVTNDITRLKDAVEGMTGALNPLMLRAPGGPFAPRDIFRSSGKWKPYQQAYFYGWDIQPGSLDDEIGTLAGAFANNAPDNAIILLHSNKALTRDGVVSPDGTANGQLKNILIQYGYTQFRALPRATGIGEMTDHIGYDPIGSFAESWVTDGDRTYTHYEDDGLTPIPWP